MIDVSETKIEDVKVLSFKEWGAKLRAAAAVRAEKRAAEQAEIDRKRVLFDAFRL